MTRITSLAELKKLRDEFKDKTDVLSQKDHLKSTIQVKVAMATCGIASGAREVLDTLLTEIEAANVTDIFVTTSGCMGLCSREPLVTVEIVNQDPIKYEYMNPNKMRQVFKRHILDGEIQLPFVLARGTEITR